MLLSRNKTPLTAVGGLSDEQILVLKACGVRTWEEYCAYAHTYSGVDFGGSDMFRGKVGDAVFEGIANATVKERPAGFIIPDDSLQQMMMTCGETFSTVAEADVVVGDFHKDGLPHEVRLIDRMPSVKDQGERGTCTAFASVALCEFAEGCETELSPQFLYWASKERDGRPNHEGTYLDTVQSVLHEIGVCEECLWPYNTKPAFDNGVLNAGQGPAPEVAVEDARNHRVSCRALSPKSVREFRKLLAAGYPVVVGLTTFRSWTGNPMTAETGWVPMPYMRRDEDGGWQPLEKPGGGHAMCLVGYVDDRSVAGGGYFIVRNSWGEDWASECEEGAGHALIPYRYVALFCHSAFTLLDQLPEEDGARKGSSAKAQPVSSAASGNRPSALDKVPRYLHQFARKLDRPERDYMGALLPAGTYVLSLPQSGSPLVECKESNFASEAYRAIMAAARYPNRTMWSREQMETYDFVLRRKQDFCAKVDTNLEGKTLLLKLFPDFRFSWDMIMRLGVQRIGMVSPVKELDFADSLLDALLEESMPVDMTGTKQIPADWRDAMAKAVSARVYKVVSSSLLPSVVYAVEVFATPFEIDAGSGVCRFARPSARLVDIVRECACTALSKKDKKWKNRFVFYSVGTGLPLDKDLSGIHDGTCAIVVSGPADGGRWDVRRPSYLTGQTAYRDFVDRLMPATQEDVVSAVRKYVDGLRVNGSSGTVTVDEIVDHLHDTKGGTFCDFPPFRQTAIIRALLQMQGENPGRYAVCQKVGGTKEVFVIPPEARLSGEKPYRGRCWLANLLLSHSIHFIGVTVCSAFVIGKSELASGLGWGQNIALKLLLAAATMFVSSLVQQWFNRRVASIERN